MEAYIFYLLAGCVIVASIGVVAHPNAIGSAVALIFTLFSTAGLFVLLQAHFMSAIQILVYVGAIMVLFLFIIMLMDLKKPWKRPDWSLWPWFASAAFIILLFLNAMLQFLVSSDQAQPVALPEDFGSIEKVSELLFGPYIVGFEVVSILLLVAIVGSIMLTVGDNS